MSFEQDIQSRDTNLFPIVVIDNNIFLSTNSVTLNGQYYSPILINVPSLKESIDIEERKYKISNLNLSLSNFPHEGVRFSEMVEDSSLINKEVNISWVGQSNEPYLIYKGQIRRYTHDDEKVTLVVEDRSQSKLHKDLPLSNLDGNQVPEKYKNKPIPIVYGKVTGSPCVIVESPFASEEYLGGNRIVMKVDDDLRVNVDGDHGLKLYESKYISIPSVARKKDFAGYGHETGNQWIAENNEIIFTLGDAGYSETGDGMPINAIENNMIIAHDVAYPIEALPVNEGTGGANLPNNTNTTVIMKPSEYMPSGKMITISGTKYYDANLDEFDGSSLTTEYCEHWGIGNDDMQNFDDTFNRNQLQCSFKTDVITPSDLVTEAGYLNAYCETHVHNVSFFSNNSSATKIRIHIRFGGNTWITHPNGDLPFATMEQGEDDASWINHINDYRTHVFGAGSNNIWGGQYYLDYDEWLGFPLGTYRELGLYTKFKTTGNTWSSNGALAMSLEFPYIYINHWMLIDKMREQDYFANVNGRLHEDRTAPSIIADILANELNDFDVLARIEEFNANEHYSDWKYDFCINEKVNSKKLIETLGSASPFLPRYGNSGEFKFDVITETYKVDDADVEIKEEDCIKWSYTRTKIEDVYTKIKFKYDWNFGRGEFDGFHELDVTQLEQFDANQEYFNYYGINMDDNILEIDDDRGKFIRDKETAEKYVKWLLYWHCNQHLKVKVRLGLKHLGTEVGNIIVFDKILGDIKPYGIDYSQDASYVDGNGNTLEGFEINKQQSYPVFLCTSTNKTLEYIEIEMIQMHNLSDSAFPSDWVGGSMALSQYGETAWNFNSDADYSDGSEIYASDFVVWNKCSIEIHPAYSSEDDSSVDVSTNYVGNLEIGAFQANDLNDSVLDAEYIEGTPYYFWLMQDELGLGDYPLKIYLVSECTWQNSIPHEITLLKLENSDGDFISSALVDENLELPISNAMLENLDTMDLVIKVFFKTDATFAGTSQLRMQIADHGVDWFSESFDVSSSDFVSLDVDVSIDLSNIYEVGESFTEKESIITLTGVLPDMDGFVEFTKNINLKYVEPHPFDFNQTGTLDWDDYIWYVDYFNSLNVNDLSNEGYSEEYDVMGVGEDSFTWYYAMFYLLYFIPNYLEENE